MNAITARRLKAAATSIDAAAADGGQLAAAATEALGGVFASLMRRLDNGVPTLIHVTASTTGEGTSTVARGLAGIAAATGWCATGLIEIVADGVGHAAPTDSRYRYEVQRAGALDDPIKHRTLLDQARASQLLTVLDCPPVSANLAIAARAHLADGVLLVVAAEHATRACVSQARETLAGYGADVIGAVFNRRRSYLPRPFSRWL